MVTIYLCFLAGGAVLPVVSFLLGSFGDTGDIDVDTDIDTDLDIDTDIGTDIDSDIDIETDIDTDFDMNTDVDINATVDGNAGVPAGTDINIGTDAGSILSIGLFPSSLMSLSALAITFGAVGAVISLTWKSGILTFLIAIITGYLASVVVQTIIKTLKKVQKRNYGLDENELLLYDGKIVDTILPGQMGTVSFTTLKSQVVSYPAKAADAKLRLGTGKIVKVIELKNGIIIVEPKNKYE